MKIWVDGRGTEADARPGESLLAFLSRMGCRLNAPCGGNGRCGKCKVRVENAGDPSKAEAIHLTAEEIAEGIRLACRTMPFEGMRIHIGEAGERPAHILTEGGSAQYPFRPQVAAKELKLEAPSLQDQSADLERVSIALEADRLGASRGVLRQLPGELRRNDWKTSAVLMGGRLLGLNPKGLYGVAVDIGTTTLACYLLDLQSGRELAVASALNPQRAHGDDVVTRCGYASAGGLDDLQKAVASEIDCLIGRVCAQAGVKGKISTMPYLPATR